MHVTTDTVHPARVVAYCNLQWVYLCLLHVCRDSIPTVHGRGTYSVWLFSVTTTRSYIQGCAQTPCIYISPTCIRGALAHNYVHRWHVPSTSLTRRDTPLHLPWWHVMAPTACLPDRGRHAAQTKRTQILPSRFQPVYSPNLSFYIVILQVDQPTCPTPNNTCDLLTVNYYSMFAPLMHSVLSLRILQLNQYFNINSLIEQLEMEQHKHGTEIKCMVNSGVQTVLRSNQWSAHASASLLAWRCRTHQAG